MKMSSRCSSLSGSWQSSYSLHHLYVEQWSPTFLSPRSLTLALLIGKIYPSKKWPKKKAEITFPTWDLQCNIFELCEMLWLTCFKTFKLMQPRKTVTMYHNTVKQQIIRSAINWKRGNFNDTYAGTNILQMNCNKIQQTIILINKH